MAKVLEKGNNPKKLKAEYKCSKCNSTIEFIKKDIISDYRDGDYVQCPVCRKAISVDLLNWEINQLNKA